MITLIHGDCLVEMKNLPDKSLDLILCDLPYGTTQNKWDIPLPLDKLWGEYNRLIKDNGAILLFAQFPYAARLAMSNIKNFRYDWVWKKNVATGHLNAKKMPLKAHDQILVFYKHLPTYNPQLKKGKPYKEIHNCHSSNYGKQRIVPTTNEGIRYPQSILGFNREIGLHPTQKPVALCEYLIKTYSNVGDTVLDNCMGSGTVGVACKNTERNFIGIESNEKYFLIAKERIEKQNGCPYGQP